MTAKIYTMIRRSILGPRNADTYPEDLLFAVPGEPHDWHDDPLYAEWRPIPARSRIIRDCILFCAGMIMAEVAAIIALRWL